MPSGGRNAEHEDERLEILNQSAQKQLKSIISRVENVEKEEAELREFKKEIYTEAKGNGFDPKVLKKLVRLRKMDPAKRREEQDILDLYEHATEEPDAPEDEDDYA